MSKHAIKSKLIVYRMRGYSVKELANMFKVSTGTVSVWTRNLQLGDLAKKRLLTRIKKGQLVASENRKLKSDILDKVLADQVRSELSGFNHEVVAARLLCAMIYWCEGSKNTNAIKFTNSDPALVKHFIELLELYFFVPRRKIRALVHLHQYHDPDKQLRFWATKLCIGLNQFNRSYIKPNTGKRTRVDYPGCITVIYYDTMLTKKLLSYSKVYLNKI